ncbi:hypothetical protein BDF20DRAFT_920954 [Mycotypha africana]|uniref:uncharacterized protein n=1 Tax=Mycotypha africana TaxID=64632 RepID=UPI002300B5B9|nr:uncharacterized protein BDF20DRAFT_920954 [Mycotypha africana]KAI8991798.1 hypothetical protein BDF20DRAFT_920954 [Mycotypha africana]
MLRHLSKIATKFTGGSPRTSDCNVDIIDEYIIGLNKLEMGIEKVLDDKILDALGIFNCSSSEDKELSSSSPYIAFGKALFDYITAMLTLDMHEIDEVAGILEKLQLQLLRYMNDCKKRRKSATAATVNNHNKTEVHLGLLNAHCTFMMATLQIVRNSWFDNIKAIYDFRKALKIYETLLEKQLGITIQQCTVSSFDRMHTPARTDGKILNDDLLESGIYFGLGLFNMVLSLSPLKVRKILSSLGYRSTLAMSIHLLERSQESSTMYSRLSSIPQFNSFLSVQKGRKLLEQLKQKFPNGRIWYIFEAKLQLLAGDSAEECLDLLNKAKEPTNASQQILNTAGLSTTIVPRSNENSLKQLSITGFSQFRCWILHETGWTHMYSGNYLLATEAFFALETLCKSSSLFYHYIATCCMLAAGLYERASLEARQMVNILDHKKKKGYRLSANEQYIEAKVRYWNGLSNSATSKNNLKDVLRAYHAEAAPVWELLYLWNGLQYCKEELLIGIKEGLSNLLVNNGRQNGDNVSPLHHLIVGVICRDKEGSLDQALNHFESILSIPITDYDKHQQWAIPYAMYEIAVTTRLTVNEEDNGNAITIWIRNIKNYYIQNQEDKEWDNRMELRCQLLSESCVKSKAKQ